MVAILRRPIYLNDSTRAWHVSEATSVQLVSTFHRRVPGYPPTRLISLKHITKEIGIKAVYLKDEGQ